MFMWAAIISFLVTIFAAVIYLFFHNAAVEQRSKTDMRVHFYAGLCIIIGIIMTIVFLVAAARYE
jgi:hypothetical protein